VPDPCESATFQWRSPGTRGPGKRVDCHGTSNVFYAHPMPGHVRALESMERGFASCQ
jgi:hypothetical protein